MNVRIVRVETGPAGTFGVMCIENQAMCVTLEPPDLNNDGIQGNEIDRSCIPAGHYKCRPFKSKHHGYTYRVLGVKGRQGILFHKGNASSDTKGCIVLGLSYGTVARTVYDSAGGMTRFMAALEGCSEFDLCIENRTFTARQ